MALDSTDIRMIERLQADGRSSLRELADALDLSPSTVSNRFHRLREDGVITGFRPVLDHEEIGFDLTAIVELTIDPDRTAETVAALQEKDGIVAFYEVTGETDAVLVCKFTGREDMNDCVKAFQQVDGVTATNTKVVLDSVEEDGRLDLRKPGRKD
ncbi:MAG: Lrp/AsnC family transcriptional regulator [Candidatus Nanohaloarchaea archaeon]|nr:Lrp/AsnC family transcriptional regulator [Candidatus Nanohaloarchaea archaeon]